MYRWCCLSILLFALFAQAQVAPHASFPNVGDQVQIEMKDGRTQKGRVEAQDNERITLAGRKSALILDRADIAWIRVQEGEAESTGNLDDHPSPNQYFNVLSAHMLDRGGAQYRMRPLFGHAAEIGITSHFSLAGGFDATGPRSFTPGSPVIHLRPKFGVPVTQAVHLYTSALVLNMPYYGTFDGGSRARVYEHMINGGITLGTRDDHITVGGGFQLPHEQRARELIEVAGSWRPLSFISVVGDARSIPALGTIDWHAGLRFHGRTWAVDMAMSNEPYSFHGRPIPWFGIIVKP